jgi:hypothetical protein
LSFFSKGNGNLKAIKDANLKVVDTGGGGSNKTQQSSTATLYQRICANDPSGVVAQAHYLKIINEMLKLSDKEKDRMLTLAPKNVEGRIDVRALLANDKFQSIMGPQKSYHSSKSADSGNNNGGGGGGGGTDGPGSRYQPGGGTSGGAGSGGGSGPNNPSLMRGASRASGGSAQSGVSASSPSGTAGGTSRKPLGTPNSTNTPGQPPRTESEREDNRVV